MSKSATVKKAQKNAAATSANAPIKRVAPQGDFVFVVTTMANAYSYNFHKTIDGVPRVTDSIVLRGGAGIPNQVSGFGELAENEANGMPIWTPQGMVTPVRRERYNKLKDHWLFKKHLAKGYVSVVEQNVLDNHGAVKKIVEGMETHDPMAPMNQATFAKYAARMSGKNVKIVTNKDAATLANIDKFG